MRAAHVASRAALTGSLAGLMACAGGGKGADAPEPKATYLGAEVTELTDELVQINLSLKGGRGRKTLNDYARCVAAGQALKRDAGFVRHIRTLAGKEGGVWRADAVYSVTAGLPDGLTNIDAEVTVEECADRGIPTE